VVTTGDQVRTSTASAIDLAGSEDNRRTDNGKERLVESASINKSLFVLAKCVEAIGSKQGERVPYRESKMTRILSLGQNNGLTVMILNLAPVRSFHLETLSSLNFANRTKKIEVREVENEPVFKGCPRAVPIAMASSMHRQPLRPLANTFHNATVRDPNPASHPSKKSTKAFEVYADKARQSSSTARGARIEAPRRSSPLKRPSETHPSSVSRPPKRRSPNRSPRRPALISKQTIEDIIERKVADILASRALDQPSTAPTVEISEEVQKRLELLERKIEGQDDSREQGLTFLLMAKQHAVRGEDASALKMYSMAQEYFPHNSKLELKIERLHMKLAERKEREHQRKLKEKFNGPIDDAVYPTTEVVDDADQVDPEPPSDAESPTAHRVQSGHKSKTSSGGMPPHTTSSIWDECVDDGGHTPRTKRLLEIINTRDITQIRLLKGVGAKKAEAILDALPTAVDSDEQARPVNSLGQLGRLKGVGPKTVDSMRFGLGGLSFGKDER
jgi:protein transport protein SEC24